MFCRVKEARRETERWRNRETGSQRVNSKYTDHNTAKEQSARGKEEKLQNGFLGWVGRTQRLSDPRRDPRILHWSCLAQLQRMKLKIRQRTWTKNSNGKSQTELARGLFFGPKNVNKIKPKHPDDEDKSYQSVRQHRHLWMAKKESEGLPDI